MSMWPRGGWERGSLSFRLGGRAAPSDTAKSSPSLMMVVEELEVEVAWENPGQLLLEQPLTRRIEAAIRPTCSCVLGLVDGRAVLVEDVGELLSLDDENPPPRPLVLEGVAVLERQHLVSQSANDSGTVFSSSSSEACTPETSCQDEVSRSQTPGIFKRTVDIEVRCGGTEVRHPWQLLAAESGAVAPKSV